MHASLSNAARLTLALAVAAAPAFAQQPTPSSGTRVEKQPPTTTQTSRGETAPTPRDSAAAAAAPLSAESNAIVASLLTDAHAVGLLHESNVAEIRAGELAQQRASDAEVRTFAQRMVTDHTALDQQGTSLATSLGVTPALPDSALPRAAERAMTLLNSSGGAAPSPNAPTAAPVVTPPADTTPKAGAPVNPPATPTTAAPPTAAPTNPPASPMTDTTARAAPATGGSDFDRAYIAQQVADHQRTLALVDAAIARTQNAQLRSSLETQVRPKIAEHLQHAQQLQQRLGGR